MRRPTAAIRATYPGDCDCGEPRLADVRVHLRRPAAPVAEELLNVAEAGARIEEVRGEGVPERVRCHVPVDSRADGDSLDDLLDGARGVWAVAARAGE